MPTYGDEQSRGFYLRDGGYYFAISDIWDLKVLGEIYTKGSWGVSLATTTANATATRAASFSATRTQRRAIRACLTLQSRQASRYNGRTARFKANPLYSSLSASVNFATSSYERNNLTSMC